MICELHIFYLGLIPAFLDRLIVDSSLWKFQSSKNARLKLIESEMSRFSFPIPPSYKCASPTFEAIHWRGTDYKLFAYRCSSLARFFTPSAARLWLLLLSLAVGCSIGVDSDLLHSIYREFHPLWLSLLPPRPNLHALKHLICQTHDFGPSLNFSNWRFESHFKKVRKLHDNSSHLPPIEAGRFILQRLQLADIFAPGAQVFAPVFLEGPISLFYSSEGFFVCQEPNYFKLKYDPSAIKTLGLLFLQISHAVPPPETILFTLYFSQPHSAYIVPVFSWQPLPFVAWAMGFLF